MKRILITLNAFLLSLVLPRLPDRLFRTWQTHALARWIVHDLPNVNAYANRPRSLNELPILEKSDVLKRFQDFNTQSFTRANVRASLETDCKIQDFTTGASSGTSGNRGLFVISDAERFRWLGSIVAKTIPDLLLRRPRVAVLLPQTTPLYDSANEASPITLRVFDLNSGLENWVVDLEDFAPNVLVAPPKVLRHLAETQVRLDLQRVFSASETLDPADRPIIEAWAQSDLHQIYMASEGLFAVSCKLGRLHLAEDSVFFEFSPVGDGLVNPIVSCFRRSTQILARYRMNDLLRLSDQPCPCGSAFQAVDEIIGRMDDCFRLHKAGQAILVTPDTLRTAVVSADPSINDFRLIQLDATNVELKLSKNVSETVAEMARTAVSDLLNRRSDSVSVFVTRQDLVWATDQKLRRVLCKLPHL